MKEFSKELCDEIVNRLASTLHPVKIYLFGSCAYGTANQGSDIDLLVVVPDTQLSQRELARCGRRSLWGMRIPVDLIVCTASEMQKWSPINCNLIHTVVQKGQLIYEAGN